MGDVVKEKFIAYIEEFEYNEAARFNEIKDYCLD
jgi:hypothetical protein